MTCMMSKTREKPSALIDLGDQSGSQSVHTILTLNYSQTASSTGLELGWDLKPALNSIYTPIETPEPLRRILNCSKRRDIVLKLNIVPVEQNRCFSRIEALLDSRANTIFIDWKWAQIRKILLLLLPNPIRLFLHPPTPLHSHIPLRSPTPNDFEEIDDDGWLPETFDDTPPSSTHGSNENVQFFGPRDKYYRCYHDKLTGTYVFVICGVHCLTQLLNFQPYHAMSMAIFCRLEPHQPMLRAIKEIGSLTGTNSNLRPLSFST